MGFLTDWLTDWLKELLIEGIMGNLTGLFDTVNSRVGEIAVQVGTTPAAWNAGVFSLIRQLSETVILPIAGLILTFVPPETIKATIGQTNEVVSTVLFALLGSITLIPAFVAFPLVASLVDACASIVPIVAFLTTLTMVGVMTFPLEKREFGLKFTLIRNSLSFAFALMIALAMGVIL